MAMIKAVAMVFAALFLGCVFGHIFIFILSFLYDDKFILFNPQFILIVLCLVGLCYYFYHLNKRHSIILEAVEFEWGKIQDTIVRRNNYALAIVDFLQPHLKRYNTADGAPLPGRSLTNVAMLNSQNFLSFPSPDNKMDTVGYRNLLLCEKRFHELLDNLKKFFIFPAMYPGSQIEKLLNQCMYEERRLHEALAGFNAAVNEHNSWVEEDRQGKWFSKITSIRALKVYLYFDGINQNTEPLSIKEDSYGGIGAL